MFKGLARFHARSPRYILSPDDDSWIRLAGPHQTPWEEGTEIHDISLSGISFSAPADLSPQIGEVIKIQFTPPHSKTIASYAITTRIEKASENVNIIAVHYYKMDMQHRVALAHSLETKFSERIKEKQKMEFQKNAIELFARKEFYLMTLIVLLWFTFMSFYFKWAGANLTEKVGALFK
jgi:hypothetical protein